MSHGKTFILCKKVKGQSHELQRVCVGLQTERSIAAGYVYKPRWAFLLQCLAQGMLATPGIPGVTSPRTMLLLRDINHARQTDSLFCHALSSLQSASGKNIADVGLCTLVSAGFFWLNSIMTFNLFYIVLGVLFTAKSIQCSTLRLMTIQPTFDMLLRCLY